MPRTAGAVSILKTLPIQEASRLPESARITLPDGRLAVRFPNAFIERMQQQRYPNSIILETVLGWAELMDKEGYSAQRIQNERAGIVDYTVSKDNFILALSAATNPQSSGTASVQTDDDEDVFELSPEATTETVEVEQDGATYEEDAPVLTKEERDEKAKREYTTNDEYFFGFPRIRPAHKFAARLNHNYVLSESPAVTRTLRRFGNGRFPVSLVGEAGSGKSEFSKYCSTQTGQPYYLISFDANTEYEDCFGKYVPDGQGGFLWEDGPATLAMENGGVLALEEINMAKAQILSMFREVLTRNSIAIRSAAGYRVVTPHPDFRVIATRNPKSYAGTQELSLAEGDRYKEIEWDYPTPDIEKAIILSAVPGTNEMYIDKLIEFANETRSKKKNEPDYIRYVCSTRSLIKVASDITEIGTTLREAVEDNILTTAKNVDEEEYKYIESLVNARFPVDAADLEETEVRDPLAEAMGY